jgi:hypothetical protein
MAAALQEEELSKIGSHAQLSRFSRFESDVDYDRCGFLGVGEVAIRGKAVPIVKLLLGAVAARPSSAKAEFITQGYVRPKGRTVRDLKCTLHRPTGECLWALKISPEKSQCLRDS